MNFLKRPLTGVRNYQGRRKAGLRDRSTLLNLFFRIIKKCKILYQKVPKLIEFSIKNVYFKQKILNLLS